MPDETEVAPLPCRSVTEAIAAIMGEMKGIGKNKTAAQQSGGYAYRGIEDITIVLQPLLARHGLVFLPRATITQIREIEVNGKPWTDTYLSVEYEIHHGPSDTSITGQACGIGRDNSDKGANKAMTQAFKYILLQVFCIADPEDDSEGSHHEADRGTRSVAVSGDQSSDAVSPAQMGKIRAQMRELGLVGRSEAINYVTGIIGRLVESVGGLTKAEASKVIEAQIADLAKMKESSGANGPELFPYDDER
jgi:hypothetical protein